jgi:predicted secreted protein
MQVLKISILFLVLFFSHSFALQNNTPATDPSKPILLSKDLNQFTISLNSTPSTGYSWRLKRYDSTLIVPVSKIYQPPKNQKPGASGVDRFTFIVNKNTSNTKRNSQIIFIYLRPWSKEVAKTVTFKIVAK